jgi:hypothetical protein
MAKSRRRTPASPGRGKRAKKSAARKSSGRKTSASTSKRPAARTAARRGASASSSKGGKISASSRKKKSPRRAQTRESLRRIRVWFEEGRIVTDAGMASSSSSVGDLDDVVVARGETLVWTSDEGDVVVTIDDARIDNGPTFTSPAAGSDTMPGAFVRVDALGGKVPCQIRIGNRTGPAYGIDIQP